MFRAAQATTVRALGLLAAVILPHITGWITPLPDGLEITTDYEARVIQGEWTVLITLDEPAPAEKLVPYTDKLIDIISTTPRLAQWERNWNQRLGMVKRQCENPDGWRTTDVTLQRRQRRGLLDILGIGAHYLFGLATDREVHAVHALVDRLARDQQRIVSELAEFTTVVNHSLTEIQTNRRQINIITWHLTALANAVKQSISHLDEELRLQQERTDVELLVSELERAAHRYEQSYGIWERRKENLEAGRLTENLLPPDILKSILKTAVGQDSTTVQPLQWYYEYTTVLPIWSARRLVYKVQLPVVAYDSWHHVNLKPWPVPLREWQAQLELPREILRNTKTGDLDITPECYGAHPRVCRRGLITHATRHPCLQKILNAKPSYDEECPVTLKRRFPMDMVHPQPNNEFVLSTAGTELTLLCTGSDAETVNLKSGVYRIALKHPCSLRGSNWTLPGVFQRTTNITFKEQVPMLDLNMSFVKMLTTHLDLDPMVFNLSTLGPVERTQIRIRELTNPPRQVKSGRSYLWMLFWLVTIPVAVLGVVAGRYHLRRRCTTPPEAETEVRIELNPLKSTEPQVDKRVLTTIYRLAGDIDIDA